MFSSTNHLIVFSIFFLGPCWATARKLKSKSKEFLEKDQLTGPPKKFMPGADKFGLDTDEYGLDEEEEK